MGQLVRYLCSKCGYEKKLSTGSGLMSLNMSIIRNIFSKDELSEYDKAVIDNRAGRAMMRQEICVCPECNEYISVEALDYELDSVMYTIRKKCPLCNKPVKPLEDKAVCLKCGGELKVERAGLWD